jgi:MFS family permease
VSILKNGLQITKSGILLSTVLFAAFFTFYFVFCLHLLPKITSSSYDPSLMQAIFSFTISATLLLSSFLRAKLMKTRVIFISVAITTIFTFLLLFISNDFFILLAVFIVGIFFSISQLSFYVHFWNTTSSEERGRIGGIIGFITLPFYFVISAVAASSLDRSGIIIIATALSLVPVTVILLKPKKLMALPKKESNNPEKRTIFLYSIPWILFSLINATIAKNIANNTSNSVDSSLVATLVLIQIGGALVGSLVGGALADFFGRRLSLALSITLYGMSMALSGIVQNTVLAYFAFVAGGLSWGILLTLYSFVVWGDLSSKNTCAEMYAIGLMSFYIAAGVGQFPTGISQIPIVASTLIGCTLIFFSNVPIALAPELSSSDFREKMKLKMHIKAAKKAAEKLENQG